MNNVLENSLNVKQLKITRCISALTSIAGLFHDIGKATNTFQAKLVDASLIGLDVMRHERLSCAILSAIYDNLLNKELMSKGDDRDFFMALSSLSLEQLKGIFIESIQAEYLADFYSHNSSSAINDLNELDWINQHELNLCLFNGLYFLVLTHHKLPLHNANDIYNATDIIEKGYVSGINNELIFVKNAPFECDLWILELQKQCLLLCEYNFDAVYKNIEAFTSSLLYIARPALVISDQNISRMSTDKAKDKQQQAIEGVVYANSYQDKQNIDQMAQPLIEHLFQVSENATELVDFMFKDMHKTSLASLLNTPKALILETNNINFAWQNTAVNLVQTLPQTGNLILVSSETGTGKTRVNFKIASALRKNKKLRITTLLGMNTLTKQTATEYINDMGVGKYACAITGSAITRYEIEKNLEDTNGGENSKVEDFEISPSSFTVPENLQCHFKPKYNQILATPIVVSTIDNLIEAIQSGKSTTTRLLQRLQTSDLIIDEIDSYSASSLIPIYKLVYLAGFFNRNLIVSSATLRPSVARTLVELFQKGLNHHNALFNTNHTISGAVISNLENASLTAKNKTQFDNKITLQSNIVLQTLHKKTVKRRLDFINASNASDFFAHAEKLHQAHHVNIREFRFSAGVIRLNNVKYVQQISCELAKLSVAETEIAVIAYHARVAAPVRYRVEKSLDNILKRKDATEFEQALLNEPEFKRTLSNATKRNVKNIMLIVVCSPIEETGRDHDFDYGITEPCSHHSLIQLAGRIRRHREAVDLLIANMLILNKSLKEQHEPNNKPYLTMPGAEITGKNLSLCLDDNITIKEAFSEHCIDYTKSIDARVCLIDYPQSKVNEASFSNLNKIEVQQVHNAYFDTIKFIDNAYIRLSQSHAKQYPLRDSNTETPVWYDGEQWLMPESNNKKDRSAKTIECNWIDLKCELPNLWFNQEIDFILLSINPNMALRTLLCSPQSHFQVTNNQVKELIHLHFSPALGVLRY